MQQQESTKQRIIDPYGTLPTRDDFAREALKYLGYPSVHYKGKDSSYGYDESGFTCSGFIYFLSRKLEIPLPNNTRYVNEFFNNFGVMVDEELRERGDLIFFSNGRRIIPAGIVPTHIGILISSDEYIHSPGTDGGEIEIDKVERIEIPVTHDDQLYRYNPIGFK
ncbi:MAG: NlpC/P60 family protein, partial [Candidatus Micrarchaeaceae archaeon]